MRVLVIAPFYRWFVKGLVEAQSLYLDEVYVLLHYNILAEISKYIPLGGYFDHVRMYTKCKIAELRDNPENVHIHEVPTIYFLPDGKNKRLGDKLANIFYEYIKQKNIKFDLIHAHFTYPQGYVAVKLGQKFGVPAIVTAHGHDVYDMPFRNKKWRSIIEWTLKHATHITTVSQRNRDIILKDLKIDGKKVSLIPNGYNPNKFRPMFKKSARSLLGIPQNKKIILNVGNLYPVKGHRYLLDAMKRVVSINKDVILYIIGSGSLQNSIQRQIKNLNLEDYVKLVGAKPHDEIPLWMNAADLFVLPSLNEGNPTVMFEALACGVPFVGTAVGGIPEIITSEDYGLLCEPANPDDLAEKILIALEKEWDREKIRKYAEQFTWERITQNIIEIYKRCCEDNPERS